VVRFHTIAPIRAHVTVVIPFSPAGTAITPLATVTATPVPSNAPTRFITAAMTSALRRDKARVDTAEAIALAAS
jgi:hypothetical protein